MMREISNIDSSTWIIDNKGIPEDKPLPEGMPKILKEIREGDSKTLMTTDDARSYKDGYKWPFVAIVVAIIIVASGCFYGLSCHYKRQAEEIVNIQRTEAKELETVIATLRTNSHQNQELIDILQKTISQHEENVESLLDLSFAKLQSDFNFISLWACVITIVFLVFSIFSIFRTDEMLKQAQISVGQIEQILSNARSYYSDLKDESSDAVTVFRQSTQNEVDKFKGEIESLRKTLNDIERKINIFKK